MTNACNGKELQLTTGMDKVTGTLGDDSSVGTGEKVVIDTTGTGAQTITTRAFFEAAFGSAGVDLTTTEVDPENRTGR